MSSIESSVWVVLAITAWEPSNTRPAGRVRLFSLSAAEIWNSEIPFAAILSASATIRTLRSTSPVSEMFWTPSIPEISGRTRDSTMSWTSYRSRSETTLNWMTGNSSGLNRPTFGSSAPEGIGTSFTAAAMALSASAMSVPYLNVAKMAALPSRDVDLMVSNPGVPSMALSMGSVNWRTTASGSAEG